MAGKIVRETEGHWSDFLAKFAAAFFLFVALALLAGIVVSMSWNGFVSPVFGLAELDIGQGILAYLLIWIFGRALFGGRRGVDAIR